MLDLKKLKFLQMFIELSDNDNRLKLVQVAIEKQYFDLESLLMTMLSFKGAKIIKINPNTKRVAEMIDIGEFKRPTSCAFGGKDYKTLLVTSCG